MFPFPKVVSRHSGPRGAGKGFGGGAGGHTTLLSPLKIHMSPKKGPSDLNFMFQVPIFQTSESSFFGGVFTWNILCGKCFWTLKFDWTRETQPLFLRVCFLEGGLRHGWIRIGSWDRYDLFQFGILKTKRSYSCIILNQSMSGVPD